MSLSLIFILALVSILSLAVVMTVLTRKWWSFKHLKISFPEIGEPPFSIFLKKTFGNAKLEKQIVLCWKKTERVVAQVFKQVGESRVALKIKEKTDHILGRNMVIPERETSSAFLKSIAEHKRKTQQEEVKEK